MMKRTFGMWFLFILVICLSLVFTPVALAEEDAVQSEVDIPEEIVVEDIEEYCAEATDQFFVSDEATFLEDDSEFIPGNVEDMPEDIAVVEMVEEETVSSMPAMNQITQPVTDNIDDRAEELVYSDSPNADNANGTIALTENMVDVPNTKVYDGNPIPVTVTYNNSVLSVDVDYTVANGAGVDAGSYKLTVNGAGNYTGSIVKEYTITKAKREVEIKLKNGHEPKKVYDATRNLTVNGKSLLSSSDFTISNVADGDEVTISRMFDTQNDKIVQPHFNSADVGTDKTITVHFAIRQKSTNYDYSLKSGSITIGGTITPKTLTVRPCDTKKSTSSNIVNQTKVYGTADPSLTAKISGLMATDQSKTSEYIGGKLVREAGENVGKYKVSVGTVKGKGNYAEKVEFEEGYFEITPKSVDATDVGMVAIGNQTYTGSAVEPEITLKYAKKVGTKTETETLVKGTDFDVRYTNNVEAGTATVTITGKGNYNGTRTATFRILKTADTIVAPSNPGDVVYVYMTVPLTTPEPAPAAPDPAPASAPAIPTISAIKKAGKTTVTAGPGTVYQLDLGGKAGKKFKSSKKKVATVDQNGLVTVKAAGKTKITFKVGKKKRTVTLKVIDPTVPTSIALGVETTAVKKGDVVTIAATLPEGTTSGIKWKSSNKKIATVSNGVVTFKKPGKVTITATTVRGKKKAKVKFRVSK